MEPDICLIIRRAMAIHADLHDAEGWDFAETYAALLCHANDHFSGRLPSSKLAWLHYLEDLDPCELELPSADE